MRDILLILLIIFFMIPMLIASQLEASKTITFLAATPAMITIFVWRMGSVRSRRKVSPMTQLIALTVLGVCAVGTGIVLLIIWYALSGYR